MHTSAEPSNGARVQLQGVGVSPGVVVAEAFRITDLSDYVPDHVIAPAGVHAEIRRLEQALIETRQQIKAIQKDLERKAIIAEAGILDAHLVVLDDHAFIEEIVNGIRHDYRCAETMVKVVTDKFVDAFAALKDRYFSERIIDIKDVSRRLLRNLVGDAASPIQQHEREAIAVAADLTPSETALFRREFVLGIATDFGSATSHTALLAKALQIPAVVGLEHLSTAVETGDTLLIDGTRGVVILNPSKTDREEFGRLEEERRSIETGFQGLKKEPAETKDSHRIVLSANIESVSELTSLDKYGAEGVGLFRSEYLYLSHDRPGTEEEQTEIYSKAAQELGKLPFIVRTYDLGGDKYAEDIPGHPEANPFLGCRSIRMSLRHPEMFKIQLRAILRASAHGNVKLMYPMISGVEEVIAANKVLDSAKDDLRKAGTAFNEHIEVGVMIEIPSAALTADAIAPHVSFFSLGTNDLTQYALAVDRINERVAYLYRSTHPSVLRLIQETITAGHRNGIWVGLCGEMAGNPILTPLLVGMGVDELSVSPATVPMIKDSIRSISLAQAKAVAAEAAGCVTPDEVMTVCRRLIAAEAPELLELV
jgi:phosphoenolpyruvate-protein phosphotransferase (PTS system enzyme I)